MLTKKIFIGGLNTDDADALVDAKEYIGALNMRFATNESGQFGSLRTVEGNVLKTNTINSGGSVTTWVLPAGDNKTIGAFDDHVGRRIFFFNWNSNGDHGIYCLKDEIIYTVLNRTAYNLNFQEDSLIHSTSMIDDLLYWTDDYNAPRRINVEAGIKAYHPTYATDVAPYDLTQMDEAVISVIRAAPYKPVDAAYITSSSAPDKPYGYKAAYRFVYRDNEYSCFSPWSVSPYAGSNSKGYLRFTIDPTTTDDIPQDVEKIELAVRYPDGKMAIMKTFTRSEIDLFNDDGQPMIYVFNSNSVGVSVDDATANKPFDSVPLLAGTLEIGKSRLFMGDVLSGYKAPSSTSLSVSTSTSTSLNKIYKTGAEYGFGVVFYDEYGRYCGVVKGPKVSINDRAETMTSWVANVNWELLGSGDEIPTWAKYYSIVRTKCKKTNYFLQFIPSAIKYVEKDPDTQEYLFTNTVPTNRFGIALDMSSLLERGMGYTYTAGDRVNVYVGSTVYKLNVLATYGNYLIINYNASITTATMTEVYTPMAAQEDEYYFEVGNKYKITNPGLSTRAYSTTSGSIGGDVYKYDGFEQMSNISDMWNQWYTDAGRVMIISDKDVIRQTNVFYFSNSYTYGANGLNSFDALDFYVLSPEMGPLERLVMTSKVQLEGSIMLAICQRETASVYVSESQLFDTQGSAFVAKSSGVVGNVNILRGSYGTIHPESAFEYKGSVMFFDCLKGAWVKYDSNGLFPISSNKMMNYFRQAGQNILETNEKVLGWVDPYHEEFLAAMPRLAPINEILADEVLSTNSYSFTITPDCSFTGAAYQNDCSFTGVATG